MWQNFQQSFKGDILKNQLWKISRSNTVQLYEEGMQEMKLLNVDVHKWLHELEPETWVKAFQSDLPKCDILLNNICEVFNRSEHMLVMYIYITTSTSGCCILI